MNYDKSGWILPALIFILWRCVPIKELMINEQIRDRELRVIGQDLSLIHISATSG